MIMNILYCGKASPRALRRTQRRHHWKGKGITKRKEKPCIKLRRRRKRSGTWYTQTLAHSSASCTSPHTARVDAILAPWQYKYLSFHFRSHQPSKGMGPMPGPQAHKGDFQETPLDDRRPGGWQRKQAQEALECSPPLLLAAWGEAAPKHDLLQCSTANKPPKTMGKEAPAVVRGIHQVTRQAAPLLLSRSGRWEEYSQGTCYTF